VGAKSSGGPQAAREPETAGSKVAAASLVPAPEQATEAPTTAMVDGPLTAAAAAEAPTVAEAEAPAAADEDLLGAFLSAYGGGGGALAAGVERKRRADDLRRRAGHLFSGGELPTSVLQAPIAAAPAAALSSLSQARSSGSSGGESSDESFLSSFLELYDAGAGKEASTAAVRRARSRSRVASAPQLLQAAHLAPPAQVPAPAGDEGDIDYLVSSFLAKTE